jgi:light-regulated signal transduction histidine kinase (bacteriophytochrome)
MKGALSGGIMSGKELRRLSRRDLLELLIEQSEEIEELKRKLERATLALEQKEILISNSGSIAEAALRLNGVFEAADAATRQYIENVRINTEQRNTLIEHIETIETKLKKVYLKE